MSGTSQPATRVAIIGAGPSGLFLLRAFAVAERNGAKIPELVCFEKQEDWGGMWNYTWRTGVDEHGDPVHASMYRYLRSNVPKEYHEFPDYTFDQHFGKPMNSFLSREEVLDYFIGRVKDFDIRKYIQFNTAVRYVEEIKQAVFAVRVQDRISGKNRVEHFDHVVVASGHFSTPNIPTFEGLDNFLGRISHSHDFRDAREYAGQDVLLIGCLFSAEDIALQLYKFGAKSVTISYRSKPLGYNWPPRITEVPLLTKLDGKNAHFKDGTERVVDSVIFCTGYCHHFPFMADALQLQTTNRLYPDSLYKGIFLQKQPRVSYLAMQKFFFGFLGIDIQACYLRDFLLGRFSLPTDPEERARDVAKWQTREDSVKDFRDAIAFTVCHLKDLLPDIKDYPATDLDACATTLALAKDDKKDIADYRDKVFKSHCTGTMASKNAIPWIESHWDTLENPADN